MKADEHGMRSRAWLFAASMILVTVAHPPHGMGVKLCLIRWTTGLTCPGCGLTRSLSSAVRGMFADSWNYNPFGLIVLLFLIVILVVGLLPAWAQGRIIRIVCRHRRSSRILCTLFVCSFLTHGLVRTVILALR